MGDPGGGSAPWCPDCGTKLAVGQGVCPLCGLDCLAAVARDVERLNGSIHAARAQAAQVERVLEGLMQQRSAMLAAAPREVRVAARVASAPVAPFPEPEAVPGAARVGNGPSIEPAAADAGAPAGEPLWHPSEAEPLAASVAADNDDLRFPTLARMRESSALPTQASAMRVPTKVSAAGLLGVASAALFVLAGIVFVAASWSTYGATMRMLILVAFSLVFAWMARLAVRLSFADVGGALGVVSAAFVGVAIYALDYGPDGVAPFTQTWAIVGASLMGMLLSTRGLKAVGPMAAGGVLLAVVSATADVAQFSDAAGRAVPLASLVLTAGAGLITMTRRTWLTTLQRRTVTLGAFVLGAVGAGLAIGAPMVQHVETELAIGAGAASLVAWLAASWWKPLWAVGVVTALVTVGAATWTGWFHLTWGHASLATAIAVLGMVILLRCGPRTWWIPGRIGLAAALVVPMVAVVEALVLVVAPQVFGYDARDFLTTLSVSSGVWPGAALIVISVAALAARIRPERLHVASEWEVIGPVAWAGGTVLLALDAAARWGYGLSTFSGALIVAAVVQWCVAGVWRGTVTSVARTTAVVIAGVGALHAVVLLAVARDTTVDVRVGPVAATVGAALVLLAAAAVKVPWSAGAAASLAALGVPTATWYLTGSPAHTTTALATVGAACLIVARFLAERHAPSVKAASLLASLSIVPIAAVAIGALVDLYGSDGVGWEPAWLVALAATTLCALASRSLGAVAAKVLAVSGTVGALLVPSPFGWIALAALAIPVTEAGLRWRGRRGLAPSVGLGLAGGALVVSAAEWPGLEIALLVLAVAAVWMIGRLTEAGPDRDGALLLAPLAAALATATTLRHLGMDVDIAIVCATGVAFAIPLVAVWLHRDPGARMATATVGVTTLVGPMVTGDAALACVVYLLAAAAWLALAALGVPRARWVSLGLLTPASAAVGIAAGWSEVEAYTVVPAASLLYVGFWWLRRDPSVRTYAALSPGLGVAIVPSFVAMIANPEVLVRPALLLVSAVVLASLGVARRWFAPILATAVIGVAVALAQVLAEEALVPRWMSAAFIGGILLSLAFVAERIKEMR